VTRAVTRKLLYHSKNSDGPIFFGAILPLPEGDAEFESRVKKAMRLAKSKAALGLPGYLGPAD
jgi:hypothetical protein